MNKNVDGGGAFGSIMSIECVHLNRDKRSV